MYRCLVKQRRAPRTFLKTEEKEGAESSNGVNRGDYMLKRDQN